MKTSHEGHRERLLDLVFKVGIENVSNIQALEFILTYVYPRGDTNPLAHRLLDKFGSVAGVFSASVEDLKTVYGVGDRAAKKIVMLPEIFNLYLKESMGKKPNLMKIQVICDYLDNILRLKKTEELHIIGLNASGYLVRDEILAKGTLNFVGISAISISNFIISCRPAYIVISHNHPGGSAMASRQDETGTQYIEQVLAINGVQFVDHFIVGLDGIYSIKNKRMIREYKVGGFELTDENLNNLKNDIKNKF